LIEQQTGSRPITPERLKGLFRPSSVAMVGASDKSQFSQYAFANLIEFGFGDRVHLVNRRGEETHGRPSVKRCVDIGEPVDVAFMMVPQAGTPDALSDAAAAGIRNAVILSAGYAEAGEAGRTAQDELVAHAQSLDMVLLGPNHLGFANFVDQIPVCPIPGLPHRSGPVGLLSQSGASTQAMIDFATQAGVDLSYAVTLGNEAMISVAHVLDFLVEDEQTKAIAIFMETIRDPELFRAAAGRAAEADKAIVVLKAGSSELSARTAAAHTGALVGDDRTIGAIFRELGVIRVDSIEDALLTAGAAAHLGRLDRPGIGVVSISGGACDIVADRADDLAADLPELQPQTLSRLGELLPGFGTAQNPLDVTGAAVIDPTIFKRSIEIVADDPAVGVVAAICSLPWRDEAGPWVTQPLADQIGAGIAAAGSPAVYVNQVQQPITRRTREVLDLAGVPHVLAGLTETVLALRNLGWWSEATRPGRRRWSPEAPAPVALVEVEDRRGSWSEAQARELLARAGVPTVPAELVTSAADAVAAAAAFDGPVALKVSSPDILHKSDIGGVALGISGDDAVAAAYEKVTAAAAAAGGRVEGVLVAPMRSGGVEILVGVVRDPDWGPMLALALGGIYVEVLDDSVLMPLPVSPARVGELLGSLRGAPLLRGARGFAPADLDALASVVAAVGDLALGLGEDLESLEVNPLHVDGSRIEALDALVTWRRKE
jgi:acyl-CoA synthetase (NDP forming)